MAVIIIAIIAVVVHLIRRGGKRRRRRRVARPLPVRVIASRPSVTDAQRERAERAAEKKAAAERWKEFQRMQAEDDLIHLQQQKHDVLVLYGMDEDITNDPNRTLAARRAAYSRNINRNNQVRRIEKQIEKAQFIIAEP